MIRYRQPLLAHQTVEAVSGLGDSYAWIGQVVGSAVALVTTIYAAERQQDMMEQQQGFLSAQEAAKREDARKAREAQALADARAADAAAEAAANAPLGIPKWIWIGAGVTIFAILGTVILVRK